MALRRFGGRGGRHACGAPLLPGLQECLDIAHEGFGRDRLGNVAVESGLDHAIAVAHHGKRRNAHQRNRAQLGVAFYPLGYFETIDSGKLNIADDEIRPLLLGKFQALEPVARRQRRVAERLQQVTHQLQVVDMIFDNQNTNRHCAHAFGTSKVKRLPFPYSLLKSIRPPSSAASLPLT